MPGGGVQWPLPSARLRATAVGGLRITTRAVDKVELAAFIDAIKVCTSARGRGCACCEMWWW